MVRNSRIHVYVNFHSQFGNFPCFWFNDRMMVLSQIFHENIDSNQHILRFSRNNSRGQLFQPYLVIQSVNGAKSRSLGEKQNVEIQISRRYCTLSGVLNVCLIRIR
jgi:hypothetical protein